MKLLPVVFTVATLGCASLTGGDTARLQQEILEIALERQCFGCDNAYRVTFRSDGTALRVRFGNARLSVPETRATGIVTRSDFAQLASFVEQQRFFELANTYRAPDVQDGEWITTAVTKNGVTKTVVNSNNRGPENLAAVERAIQGLAQRIKWNSPIH